MTSVFRKVALITIVLSALMVPNARDSAYASDMTEIEIIRMVYEGTVSPDEVFSPAFMAQVPAPQIKAITRKIFDEIGPIDSLEGSNGEYQLTTQTHTMPVIIRLNDRGLIDGLLFEPAEPLTKSLEASLAALEALADDVTYKFTKGDKIVATKGASMPLAVGSAFKLGVLRVVVDDIDQGKLRWTDVYELMPADKSLRGGSLQDFPDGAPLTLHTVAAAMISVSDNTATDMLMRIVGVDRVAKALGIDTAFTTKQLFAFKHYPALREGFLAADRPERAELLNQIQSAPLPQNPNIGHHNQGFEWYIPNDKICDLLEEIGPLDIFDINAGPLESSDWQSVRFKGGSEDGVLNLSALAIKDGQAHCMSVTLNHSTNIDHDKVVGLYKRAARQLSENN